MIKSTIKSQPNEDISILHQFDNHSWNYLSDCGMASDLTVKECQAIKAIFISHTHIDHFISFDQLLRYQIGTAKEVIICGPKNIAQHVQSKIKAYTWNLIEKGSVAYQVREIQSDNTIQVYQLEPPTWNLIPLSSISDQPIFSNDLFEVSFTILNHGIPSIAYLFKEYDSVNIDLSTTHHRGGPWIKALKEAFLKKAETTIITIKNEQYLAKDLFSLLQIKKGHSVGVIMDHDASPENHAKIIELFYKTDKVFIEAFYKVADKDLAKQNLHSYSTMSAQVMQQAEVKEAIPVHFSRRYTEKDILELLEEFSLF